MAQVLLFDLFGVIARHQSPPGCARIEQAAGAGPDLWPVYWGLRPPYDRGSQLAPDYWQAVARKLGTSFTAAQISDLVSADVASWTDVDDDMVALVTDLHERGTRLGMLSNIPEEIAVRFEELYHWLEFFEVRAFSCRIGHAKPEPEAFAWCARALRAEPAEILFIDDRIDNVTASQEAGMRSHLFTSIDSLRSALSG